MNKFDEQYHSKSDEELRRDIERTRERVRGEAEQLSEKLTPAHFKDEAKRSFKEKARGQYETRKRGMREGADRAWGRARHGAEVTVERARDGSSRALGAGRRVARESPIPVMAGAAAIAGLTWWLMDRRRHEQQEELHTSATGEHHYQPFGDDPYYPLRGPAEEAGPFEQEPLGEVEMLEERGDKHGEELGEELGDDYGSASYSERARRLRHEARSRTDDVRHAASSRLHDTRRRMSEAGRSGYQASRRRAYQARDTAFENPLAAGAVALLAGIGIGFLLPRTRREDELLGSRRSQWLGTVREKAGSFSNAAVHGVSEAVATARGLAEERLDPSTVRQKVQHAGGQVARDVKHDVKDISRSAFEAGKEAAKHEVRNKPGGNGNGHRFS